MFKSLLLLAVTLAVAYASGIIPVGPNRYNYGYAVNTRDSYFRENRVGGYGYGLGYGLGGYYGGYGYPYYGYPYYGYGGYSPYYYD